MIDVYDEGRRRHKWWPDWRDKVLVLVASGPSAKDEDIRKAVGSRSNCRVAAIRGSVDLYPEADAVYAADEDWWGHVRGLPWFRGLRVTNARNAVSRWGLDGPIQVIRNTDALCVGEPGVVGGGGCSGFQLVNLVVQAGARGIVLVGFDMNSSQSPHWYGKNTWPGSSNPKEKSFVRWRRALDGAAATLSKLSVEVINASERSTLSAYPKMKLEDALWLLKA